MIESETGKQLSAKDIIVKSKKISQYFSNLGFGRGDIISYFSPNCADYVCVVLGVIDTGATLAFGHPNFTESEMSTYLSMLSPSFVIYSSDIEHVVSKVAAKYSKCISTSTLSASISQLTSNSTEEKFAEGKDQMAFILLSSGTTGFPKPAMIAHHAFIMNLQHGLDMERSNRKMLGILPFYHIYGLLVMLDCLCNGSTVVSMSKFSPSVFTDNISKHQISLLSIVPSLLLPLVKCTAEDLSSLNLIFIGGSVTNGSLMSALLEKFLDDSLEIYNIYGMTEASGIISWAKMSTKDIDESREKGESIGRMPKIFQSKLPDGKTGELCLKGDVFLGYRNKVEATKEMLDDDGWLHTGDLAYRLPDGTHFIVGRIKELIKYQGNQISPCELESIFRQHPDVEDVAVIGIPHDVFGELPAAVVVPKPNSSVTAEEVKQFVEDQVNPSKRLSGGVFLCSFDFIPRTMSGKVKRKDLVKKILENQGSQKTYGHLFWRAICRVNM
ncbi:hypothetical protein M8J76_007711 [Diaphorina citri]|nr:hypothetical protein M8J76_007711 [Diaphorina citri]